MSTVRIDAERETPCGWGIYLNGEAICSRNPAPKEAKVNSTGCPAINVELCSRAWGEHSNCPKIRANGGYGGSRRK